jgi:predicted O-methyltransferase YrrM
MLSVGETTGAGGNGSGSGMIIPEAGLQIPGGASPWSIARQLSAAAIYSAFLSIKSPRRTVPLMRRICNSFLSFAFMERSPIAPIPARLFSKSIESEVLLPPLEYLLLPGSQIALSLVYLVGIAKAIGAKTIFEIGTCAGNTALTLAMNLKEARIHTLDLPPDQQPIFYYSAADKVNIDFINRRRRVYEGRAEAGRIVQHLEDSAKFDYSAFRGSCELIYIDGAHSLEYVRNDSRAAYEMAAPVGAVVWDDYSWSEPGVGAYLHSNLRKNMFRLPNSRLVLWLTPGAACRLGL